VTTDGGWAGNQVYRVVVLPGVSDRFGNARKEPAEVIFSTGPPIQNTALAGLIMDRLTGRRATNGAVEAIRRLDSAAYTASSDTSGFFALRYLPAGVYDVSAFGDQNNNRRRDPSEPFSPPRAVSLGATDTATVELVILPADTTGPRLLRATLMDSLHVTLTFDDAIDVDGGLAGGTVDVVRASDSVPVQGGRFQQLKNIYQRNVPPPTARPVALPGDTTKRDSAAIRADSIRAAAAEAAIRQRPVAARDTTSLPDREVVLTLTVPLEPGTKYRVRAAGYKNVNGLTGGGTVEFDTPRRAAPPPGRTGGPQHPPRQPRAR
jgi:hypothetical protein